MGQRHIRRSHVKKKVAKQVKKAVQAPKPVVEEVQPVVEDVASTNTVKKTYARKKRTTKKKTSLES